MKVVCNILIYLLAISGAVFFKPSANVVRAQEMEVVAGGELEYQNHCAICHGIDGRGRGIMSKFLTIAPPDLTQLRKKNAGLFPFWQIYRVIDGREEIKGHGTREMPIWGARFRSDARGDDIASRSQVSGRILGLVFYLQHLQQ
jgi:mono/diheme cytochrome c family protein